MQSILEFLQSGWFWYSLIAVVLILCIINLVAHGQRDDTIDAADAYGDGFIDDDQPY